MTPTITIVVPQEDGREISLANSTSIGRLEHNHLAFPDDLLMSRQHALIRQQGADEFVVIDLGSSNGTYINSQLVVAPTTLKHGDELVVGSVLMRFSYPEQIQISQSAKSKPLESRTMMGIRVSTVVVLVCDIRSFTKLSELLSPEELARFLGVWFRNVSEEISSHEGLVDKYIGDAFMAYWTVDQKNPQHAPRLAVQVGYKLLQMAAEIELPTNEMKFEVGVGINQGVVASGNVGGSSQRDSSIMGDAVNIAFRLESACKETGCPLILGHDLFTVAGDLFPFESLGPVSLKGKSEKVQIYGLKKAHIALP
jgi:adenylate cyclase